MHEDTFQADTFEVERTIRGGKFNAGAVTLDFQITTGGLVLGILCANDGDTPVEMELHGAPHSQTPGRSVTAVWQPHTTRFEPMSTAPLARLEVVWEVARNRYDGLEGEIKTSV